jgi:LuxR family maltose regulon positive regulatory protein
MVRRGAEDALADAKRAVALEAAGGPWRDFSLWMSAIASITVGDVQAAHAALMEAIAAARSNRNVGLLHCLLGHAALMAIDRRDWSVAATFAQESDEVAGLVNIEGYLSSAPARAAHIRISVHRGDISEARQDLARSMSVRPLLTAASPGLAVQSLIAFAQAHLALADPAGARTLLAQAGDVIHVRPDLGVLPIEVTALRATIAEMPFGVAGPSSLTAAEIRVLGLLPYYLSFKEIAQRLGVKATTVKTHALSIYGKLGVSTRGEAVEIAVQAGLLERFPT